MLSCQGDWPSCCSRISGFAIAVSFPSARSDPPCPVTTGHRRRLNPHPAYSIAERSGDDVLRGEAELLHQRRPGRRGAEAVDADRSRRTVADPPVPAERDPGLDREPRRDRRRQHALAIRPRSAPRRAPSTASTPAAPGRPSRASSALGGDDELHLGAGGDQDDVGRVDASGFSTYAPRRSPSAGA